MGALVLRRLSRCTPRLVIQVRESREPWFSAAFDAKASLKELRRLHIADTGRNCCGWRLASRISRGRHGGKECRTEYQVRLLIHAVVAQAVQRDVERDAIEEGPEAGAQHGPGRPVGAGIEAPRDGDARRPIAAASEVALHFVAQSDAEGEVGAGAPIVGEEEARIGLTHEGFGRARVAAELGCSGARQLQERRLVLREGIEDVGAGEIVDGGVVEPRLSHAAAPPQAMLAAREERRIGELPIVGERRGIALRRAAGGEAPSTLIAGVSLAASVMRRLERKESRARLVDGLRVDYEVLGGLYGLLGLPLVVGARCQVEIAYALIVVIEAQFLEAHGQRVPGVDRVVQARIDVVRVAARAGPG